MRGLEECLITPARTTSRGLEQSTGSLSSSEEEYPEEAEEEFQPPEVDDEVEFQPTEADDEEQPVDPLVDEKPEGLDENPAGP